MSTDVQTIEIRDADPNLAIGGYRPVWTGPETLRTMVNPQTRRVYFPVNEARPGVPIVPGAGLKVMSYLMDDEWKQVDREVIEASQYPLRIVNDIRAAGLVVPLSPDVLVSQWYTQGDMTGAQTDMLGRGQADRDVPEITPTGAPIPMTYKDLSFSSRGIGASRRIGDGIDLTMVSLAARTVAERLEDLMINGSTSVKFNGLSLYGILSHPNVVTDTAANFGGGDWATNGNAEKTVAGMINSMNGANWRGPFTLYVSETQYNQVAHAHVDGEPTNAIQRMLEWESIRAIHSVPATSLADGKVALVQMTRDVLEYAEGSAIQTREWQSGNGMEIFFRIMAIGGPRVKARQNGECGIRVATAA